MFVRSWAAAFGIVVVLAFSSLASAQDQGGSAQAKRDGEAASDSSKGKGDTDTPKSESSDAKTEKATFGGGCFWCMEAVFERLEGVKSVVSGYAGGNVPNPTYEMVHTGLTGHAEVIQIEFDPVVLPYEKLLKVFWASHDPTQLNMQGVDVGTQYRSVIFYHNDAQKVAAQKSYQDLKARRVYRSPIVTQLVPMTQFFPAETYHQDYYRNNPFTDYSLIHIAPKLKKLKMK
jgi:peptide-methionine (S)-S-oxide reductase